MSTFVENEIRRLMKRAESLEKENKDLKKKLNSQRIINSALETQIESLEQNIDDLNEHM